jgi:hypothetical protein
LILEGSEPAERGHGQMRRHLLDENHRASGYRNSNSADFVSPKDFSPQRHEEHKEKPNRR